MQSLKVNISASNISKYGIIVDPERVEAIEKTGLPSSKKAIQSFLEKINFVRIFVPNFAEIVRPLQDLVKKDVVFMCSDVYRDAFKSIKLGIMEAPAVMAPIFQDILYYTLFPLTFNMILCLLKEAMGMLKSLYFMRSTLKGVEFNYTHLEKQAYTIDKSMKHFKPYLLKPKTNVIVSYTAVRNVLI